MTPFFYWIVNLSFWFWIYLWHKLKCGRPWEMFFFQWIKYCNQGSGGFFFPSHHQLTFLYLSIYISRYWMPTSVLRNSVTLPCRSSWQRTTTPCRSTPISLPASRIRSTLSTRLAWIIIIIIIMCFGGWVNGDIVYYAEVVVSESPCSSIPHWNRHDWRWIKMMNYYYCILILNQNWLANNTKRKAILGYYQQGCYLVNGWSSTNQENQISEFIK